MDRYTKAVLTVIAVALVVIAVRDAVPEARAFSQGCGDIINPCSVTNLTPLIVKVQTSAHDPLYVTAR